MKPDRVRALGVLGLAALAGTGASSCSAPPRTDTETRPAPRAARHLPAAQIAQIAQIGYGRDAGFVTCQPPNCPGVTPKTLAAEVPLPPPEAHEAPEKRRVEPGPSPDRHETPPPGPTPVQRRTPPVATPRPGPAAGPIRQQVTVHFGFGSAALTPAARGLIDLAAGALHDARRVAISGRTDSIGPAQVNESLARARARAVLDHLRDRHPRLARAATLDAKGGCCFTAANDTPQGRARNRRVEIVLDGVERDGDDP